MAIVSLLMGLALAFCGLAIAAISLIEAHGADAKAIGVVLGVVVALGSVPFLRAAKRISTSVLDSSVRARDRRASKTVVMFLGACAVSGFFMPVPVGARIVDAIIALVTIPLVLVVQRDRRTK